MEYLTFITLKPIEKDEAKIPFINKMFEKVGMTIELKKIEDSEEYYSLLIGYDAEKYEKTTKRNAGLKLRGIDYDVTVEEIRNRMKTESAEKIASSLNIGRATLFRKLKAAEENKKKHLF